MLGLIHPTARGQERILPAARGLAILEDRIRAARVPRARRGFVLATWNIREFGKRPRRSDSIRLIAEVLRVFDLTVIIELRENLGDLRAVMRHLGPHRRVVFSECIRDAGGNRERIAFLYDTRTIAFTGLASHLHPPREKRGDEYLSQVSWWRPPYVASFRSARTDFILAAAHIRWGRGVGPRCAELAMLAEWARAYAKSPHAVDKDLLLIGDFNVPSLRSETFAVLASRGLVMPEALLGEPGTDLARGKRYDQILAAPGSTLRFTGRGGALDFYAGSFRPLYPSARFDKRAFTYEMSDHLPLWAELAC